MCFLKGRAGPIPGVGRLGALLGPATSANASAARVSSAFGSRELQRCVHEDVRAAGYEADDLFGPAPRPGACVDETFDDVGLCDARIEHLADIGFAQRGVRAHCLPLLLRLRRWPWIPAGVICEPPRSSDLVVLLPDYSRPVVRVGRLPRARGAVDSSGRPSAGGLIAGSLQRRPTSL